MIEPPKKARSEMLPLMDMIFLLMVTFIFMMLQMRPDGGIAVELPDIGEMPEAPAIEKQEKIETVTISIDKDNKVYIDKDETSMEKLISTLQDMNSETKRNFILKGDKAADYGHVIQIFNSLRVNGFTDVIFDVESSATKPK